MKIFKCTTFDDLKSLVDHICELDQPVYVYSDDNLSTYLVSEKELEDPQIYIEESIIEIKPKIEDNILDDVLDQDDLDELSDFFNYIG